MDILELFCEELNITIPLSYYYEEVELLTDFEDFTVVDGEEGDYGIIKYLDTNYNLLAIKNVYGGYEYDYEFTDYCKELLEPRILDIVKYKIEIL